MASSFFVAWERTLRTRLPSRFETDYRKRPQCTDRQHVKCSAVVDHLMSLGSAVKEGGISTSMKRHTTKSKQSKGLENASSPWRPRLASPIHGRKRTKTNDVGRKLPRGRDTGQRKLRARVSIKARDARRGPRLDEEQRGRRA